MKVSEIKGVRKKFNFNNSGHKSFHKLGISD